MRFTKKLKFDTIVVGGGASGLMAAVILAQNGCKVCLLEQTGRLGKKLLITGKGRCNVTNDCTPEDFLKSVNHNSRFLYSAIHGFPPNETIAFFTENGCPLKTERGGRVFPMSDVSSDVLSVFTALCRKYNVTVLFDRAIGIIQGENGTQGMQCPDRTVFSSNIILCCGGCSYPTTGSDGSGYRLAQAVGHTIIPPTASLVPLQEEGTICSDMQGLSLKNIGFRITDINGKTIYKDFGELLFTHFGLSGPVVLSASCHMENSGPYTAHIDCKPALDENTLDARLLRDFEAGKNKNLSSILSGLLPKSMVPVFLRRLEIPGEYKGNSMTREQRHRLLHLLKDFTVLIAAKRPIDEAIITAGGVSVKEINPKTMESKLLPGLYFAGEIIDCDAYTGGYNLQIAWSTAMAAARAVLNSEERL